MVPMQHTPISRPRSTFTEHQAQPTSNSSPSLRVARKQVHMCVQMHGPGDLSFNTKSVSGCWSHPITPTHKSKKRACACWSKINPQNGGLKVFFKAEFKSETSIDKS